jgi:uncharacterized protein (TIGR00725 family)
VVTATTRVRRAVIGIMGAGRPSEQSLEVAHQLGRLIAERGWILLTGGRPAGIMAAACAGAKRVPGSITLGILPDASGGEGSDVDIAVFTGMGDARNAINVLTSDVVVACGVEGPGTASEVALALNAGKPVILVRASSEARSFFNKIGYCLEASEAEPAVLLIEEALKKLRESA